MTCGWLRIAHRGASGSAPEHTRAAFARALVLGVDMIELDVQLTRDCRLVALHDATLERTTSGRGLVRAHDLTDLRSLDAGSWFGAEFAGERVMTLEEVIALVGGRTRLNVEMKGQSEDWPILARRLCATLRDASLIDSCVVSCFDATALREMRRLDAEVRLGLLWQQPDLDDAWQQAADIGAVSVHPHWAVITPESVAAAAGRGLQVLAWTVNDVPTMRRMLEWGVNGLISDFPERFDALIRPPRA